MGEGLVVARGGREGKKVLWAMMISGRMMRNQSVQSGRSQQESSAGNWAEATDVGDCLGGSASQCALTGF